MRLAPPLVCPHPHPQPAVIPTLGHDRPTVREASLVAIHELVRHGSRHVADSILSAVAVHGLEHDDPIVRAHACNALASGSCGVGCWGQSE